MPITIFLHSPVLPPASHHTLCPSGLLDVRLHSCEHHHWGPCDLVNKAGIFQNDVVNVCTLARMDVVKRDPKY